MAGGTSTASLTIEVCKAGGIGFLGGAYNSPTELRRLIHEIKKETDRPFGVNLFAVPPPITTCTPLDVGKIATAQAAMEPACRELGLSPSSLVVRQVR